MKQKNSGHARIHTNIKCWATKRPASKTARKCANKMKIQSPSYMKFVQASKVVHELGWRWKARLHSFNSKEAIPEAPPQIHNNSTFYSYENGENRICIILHTKCTFHHNKTTHKMHLQWQQPHMASAEEKKRRNAMFATRKMQQNINVI